jgi:activator of HSP90 ATPase
MFLNIAFPRVSMNRHVSQTGNEEMDNPMARVFTRRNAIVGGASALGGMVAFRCADAQQATMQEKPATAANQSRTSLHQEIEVKAASQRVFDVLLDAKQFAAFTGMPAEIDPKPGGPFKTFGGMIEGRNVEIISGQRIVQAWRPTAWDAGVYSIVHFELKPRDTATIIILDHTGFPEGDFDHLDPGWYERYWNPLKKYLA